MKNGLHVDDGVQRWYKDNVLHRLDGPAIIHPEGYQAWFNEGFVHRLDGPAITTPEGYQGWYKEDLCHRLDGPAVIHPDGKQEWWVDGKMVTAKHLTAIGMTDYPADGFTDVQIAMLRVMR